MLGRIKAGIGALLASLVSLSRYGSPDDTPGGRWWVRWQNLSKDEGDGDAPLHGRAWLNFAPDGRSRARFSWNLRSTFAHIGVHVDGSDGEMGFKIALPPVALWFSFESWPLLHKLVERTQERDLSVSFHDGAIWWRLWADPNVWSETDPRWQQGSFCVVDAVFGAEVVKREQIAAVPVKVPMPEGIYEGVCTTTRVRVDRPRWLSAFHRVAEIELSTPIPIPGKGENSYDCGEDAIYSQSSPASSPADAVAKLVGSALRTRERHGGRNWIPSKPAPSPAAQA